MLVVKREESESWLDDVSLGARSPLSQPRRTPKARRQPISRDCKLRMWSLLDEWVRENDPALLPCLQRGTNYTDYKYRTYTAFDLRPIFTGVGCSNRICAYIMQKLEAAADTGFTRSRSYASEDVLSAFSRHSKYGKESGNAWQRWERCRKP